MQECEIVPCGKCHLKYGRKTVIIMSNRASKERKIMYNNPYIIIQIIIFFIHSCLMMTLLRRNSRSERFHVSVAYAVCLFNALISPLFLLLLSERASYAYAAFAVVIMVEGFVLFKDKVRAVVGLAIGCIMHYFALRAITLAAVSIGTSTTMFSITSNIDALYMSTLLSVVVHIVVLILFNAFVPPKAVKEIIANNILLNFILINMGTVTAFFAYNVRMSELDVGVLDLAGQQIVLTTILLGTFYLLLIFMIKIVMAEKYQKIIEELEHKINKDSILKTAVFNFADVVLELNLSQDKVVSVMTNSVEVATTADMPFSQFVDGRLKSVVHGDDLLILERLAPKSILLELSRGNAELVYDYRSYKLFLDKECNEISFDERETLWYRVKINSKLDKQTNDVLALLTIDEINEEKMTEIGLLEKSERDTLTFAYNKDAIKTRVEAQLVGGGHGTLFVFDIDNFKSINDTMGHAMGDEILIEIYKKTMKVFRANDYVGRFGGDEFVAFICGEIAIEEIERVCGRICTSMLQDYVAESGEVIRISASVGVSRSPDDGSTYNELFLCADTALYESKRKGKNTFTIYGSTN